MARASVAIGLGAMTGASSRWAVGELLSGSPGDMPWALILVNAVASILLGYIAGSGKPADQRVRDGAAIGFCGGLSTMSTLAVEVANGLGAGAASLSLGHSGLLLVTSLGTGGAGYAIARSKAAELASP